MKKTSGISKNNQSSPKLLDRKTVEKNRRNHRKALCFRLASLIPSHHFNTVATTSKHTITQQDQLDVAATYITQLRERIDQLKRAKEQASVKSSASSSLVNSNPNQMMGETKRNGSKLPVVELRDMGSCFEVVLIGGLERNFMLYEVIAILEDECAEVVAVSFSTVGDRVFLTVHAQVKISRVGVETSRVCERLQDLIY